MLPDVTKYNTIRVLVEGNFPSGCLYYSNSVSAIVKYVSIRERRKIVAVQTQATAWTTNRIVALVIGVVFTLIGIVGFFISSSMTPGNLLGFSVDIVHNIVHLLTGILGLWAAFGGWSRTFNRVFGIIYLLIGILGLIPGLYFSGMFLGTMHINGADNGLHLVVGLVAAAVGFFVHDNYRARTTTSAV